jgi:lysophospholipase L1-like esterase
VDESDFNPLSISGLSLWLNPNALTGVENSTVTSIPDSSGSGFPTTSISGTWLTKRNRRGDGKTWVRVPSGYQETPSKAHFPAKRGTIILIYEAFANAGTQVIAGTFYSGGATTANCFVIYSNQPLGIKAYVNDTTINGRRLNFDVAGVPKIMAIRRTGDTTLQLYRGASLDTTYTIGTLQTATARVKIGGNFGAGAGINGYLGPILEYDRALSDAELRTAIAGLSRDWLGGNPVSVFCIGNSLTAGALSTTDFGPYPEQMISLLGPRYSIYTFATSGHTTTQVNTAAAANCDPVSATTLADTVCVAWEIGNDILAGTAEATVKSNFTTLIANRKAAGYTKVIALTVPPRSDLIAGNETKRQSLNTWLLAGSSGADAIADVAAIPELQNTGNATYFADGVHYTNAGYAKVAEVVTATIRGLNL